LLNWRNDRIVIDVETAMPKPFDMIEE